MRRGAYAHTLLEAIADLEVEAVAAPLGETVGKSRRAEGGHRPDPDRPPIEEAVGGDRVVEVDVSGLEREPGVEAHPEAGEVEAEQPPAPTPSPSSGRQGPLNLAG